MRSGTSKRWATSLAALALIAPVACTPGKELHGVHQDFAGGTVKQMGLLTPTFGYALTDGRFASTEDAGKTWHDLTPVDAPAATLRAGYFFDQARAWAVVYNDATRKLVIYRSASGGASWKTVELPETYPTDPGAVAMNFVSPVQGWLAISSPHELFGTTDAGATWTKLTLPGSGPAEIGFLGANDGYAIVGEAHDHMFHTGDGGATWTETGSARVGHSCPAGASPAACGDASGPRFSLPASARRGTVTVATYVHGNPELVIACARGSAFVSLGSPPADRIPVSILQDGRVLYVTQGQVATEVTCAPGINATSVVASGLPANVDMLDFVDADHGWARAVIPSAAKATPSTGVNEGLFATADGGKTWTRLQA